MRVPRLLLPTLAVGLLSGCRGLEGTAHDLRALHTPEGAVQYRARVAGGLAFTLGGMGHAPRRDLDAWVLRAAYPEELGTDDLVFHPEADPRASAVDRPQARTLKRLRALGSYDAEDDPFTAGTQVELAAFLARDSRSKVVRERAVRILGESARRLALLEVRQSSDPAEEPEAVRARFEALAGAAAGLEGGGGPAALAAEAERLGAAELGLADWRRALRVTTALLESLGERRWREAGLAPLHERAQLECVALALGDALRDPSDPVAEAAAEEVLSFDRTRLAELFRESIEIGRWPIAAACARSIVARGLPGEEPPLDVWLERLVQSAQVIDSESIHDDQLRLLSAQALGRIAPDGFESLRWEDWVRWYWRYSDRILGDTLSDDAPGGEPAEDAR